MASRGLNIWKASIVTRSSDLLNTLTPVRAHRNLRDQRCTRHCWLFRQYNSTCLWARSMQQHRRGSSLVDITPTNKRRDPKEVWRPSHCWHSYQRNMHCSYASTPYSHSVCIVWTRNDHCWLALNSQSSKPHTLPSMVHPSYWNEHNTNNES